MSWSSEPLPSLLRAKTTESNFKLSSWSSPVTAEYRFTALSHINSWWNWLTEILDITAKRLRDSRERWWKRRREWLKRVNWKSKFDLHACRGTRWAKNRGYQSTAEYHAERGRLFWEFADLRLSVQWLPPVIPGKGDMTATYHHRQSNIAWNFLWGSARRLSSQFCPETLAKSLPYESLGVLYCCVQDKKFSYLP